MELNPPYQTIQMILLGKSEILFQCCVYSKLKLQIGWDMLRAIWTFFVMSSSNHLFLLLETKLCQNLNSHISSYFIQIKKFNRMLEINRVSRCCCGSGKQQKIQLNLTKIRGLIEDAVVELKKSERISTNNSDTSQTQSVEFFRRMSIDVYSQRTEMMLESLQKGYVMVKHSPNAKPKQKYVYISDDRKFLCWKSLQKDDQKRIQLRKIYSILRGEQQTMGYIKSKTIKTFGTCVIIKSQIRNLQLQALNLEQSLKFQIQMEQAIKNAKTIHLSYQF